MEGTDVKELSVFIDESGVFGPYESHSPYYIVTLLFHDQSVSITESIKVFTNKLLQSNLPGCTIHSGPLIRREFEYRDISMLERKRIFNIIYNFSRTTDIKYHSFIVEKRQLVEEIDLVIRFTKLLSVFLSKHMKILMEYDRIVVYYDYGQKELTKILASSFNTVLNNVRFKKAIPTDYMLLQATDMICTLELLAIKAKRKQLSKSELAFFKSEKDLYKSYLRAIQQKRF